MKGMGTIRNQINGANFFRLQPALRCLRILTNETRVFIGSLAYYLHLFSARRLHFFFVLEQMLISLSIAPSRVHASASLCLICPGQTGVGRVRFPMSGFQLCVPFFSFQASTPTTVLQRTAKMPTERNHG